MKIPEISPENRPRERLETAGAHVLSNAELLALILKTGTKKENIIELCQKLLSKYGLEGLSRASLQELQQEHGIGQAKATQILALFELYQRTHAVKKEAVPIEKAQDLADIYLPKMKHLQQEHFVAVYLDAKNKIVGDHTVSIGILNAAIIHPREVFYGAIKAVAHGLIVIHNHPSGDPEPSPEDLEVTKKLQKTGEIVGIHFLDHIILGKETWWSWKESQRPGFWVIK